MAAFDATFEESEFPEFPESPESPELHAPLTACFDAPREAEPGAPRRAELRARRDVKPWLPHEAELDEAAVDALEAEFYAPLEESLAASFRVARDDWPAVWDQLAPDEASFEVFHGELIYVSGAMPPHAGLHVQIAALVTAHAAAGFTVAADLLTRVSDDTDIAPDVNVYPGRLDLTSNQRELQDMSFEVVSTQKLGNAKIKAAMLAHRGVRRVFAIYIRRRQVLEWSAKRGAWKVLDLAGHIVDPCLAVPLPIEALVRVAQIDDDLARALIAKRNPAIREAGKRQRARGRREGRREGQAQGRREGKQQGKRDGMIAALLGVLAARGIALDSVQQKRVQRERDPDRLARWVARAATCKTAAGMFEEPRPASPQDGKRARRR